MKKFLTILLTVCLLICSFPLDLTYAETINRFEDEEVKVIIPFKDDTSAGADILKRMESEIDTDPSGFSSDTSNPYGISGDDTVTLLTKDEVFSFISINNTAVRADLDRYMIGSGGSTSRQSANSSSLDLSNESLNNLGYAQGVSFDPTGCGRKNYVAIIGYKANSAKTNGSARVVIINADNSSIVKEITLDNDKFGWLANYNLKTVASKNFFQITSGDYDGDGRDSLVVWDGCNMYEIYTSKVNSSLTWYTDSTTLNSKALNVWWRISSASSSTNVNDRLGVSLASGDVNGDGIDDLVAVSCAGEMSEKYYKKEGCGLAMAAELYVVLGEKNTRLSAATYVNKDVSGYYSDKGHTVSMAAPGVAIGDINGDGINEIVCAGFESEVSSYKKIDVKDGDTKVLVYAWYTVTKDTNGKQKLNCKKFSYSMTDISAISKDDSLRENGGSNSEKNWQQVSVECVAFDGMNTTDYVFINGYVYKLNTKSSEFEAVYEPDVFSTLKTHVLGKDVNEVFIYSAAVGNFYQSNKGEESIVLVVGYRRNKSDRYYFQRVILKKTNGDWKREIYWDGTEYRVFTDEGLLFTTQTTDREGCRTSGSLSCCIVAVDYGYDSMVAKYNRKEFVYTDPNVIAVLQAAPYFEEFDAGNSSTKYSYSESYKKSESSGSEVSFGVGLSAELQAGAVKTEVEEIVTNGITEEYEESRTTEYVITFEANDKNQVIIRRTLVYFYYYDIVSGTDSDGNYTYEEAQIVISVPQYPVITQLSIEQYNDFAAEYNKLYGNGTLKSASYYLDTISEAAIEKYYLDNEGNPYNYANDVSAYTNGYELTNTKTWMQLGHAGGVSEQGYSSELEITTTTVVSEGVSCNMKLMFGGGWGSFEAYAGITASMDALRTKGISTATMTKTETSGAVQNLSGSDEDMNYNFDWKAIAWKTDGELFNGVLFVGYAVKSTSISSLPVPVSDLTATFPSDKEDCVLLEWTSPDQDERRPQVTEFRIFRVENGNYTRVDQGEVKNTGNGKKHTYYYDVSNYEKTTITFAVQAVRSVANESLTKSKYSNEVNCVLTLTPKTVREMIDGVRDDLQSKIDALEESLENGTTDAVAKAIEDLTAAYKAADEVLKEYIDDTAEDIKESIEELEDTLTESDEALDSAIKQVQENLNSAVEELKDLIAKGDKTNADELQKAIEDLTNEYKAADELLSSEISVLSDKITALEKAANEADNALKISIDTVQENLDKAIKELNGLIADSNKANAAELKKAVDDLTAAYKAADELIKADIKAMSGKLSDLSNAMDTANGALQASVNKVQENLDAAKKELQDAINNNQAEITNKLNELKNALEAADAVINNDISDLKKKDQELDEMIATINEAIDALSESFAGLADELAALKDQISSDNVNYDNLINALEKVNQTQQNEIDTWKLISMISLGMSGLSIVGPALAVIAKAAKKRKV